MSVGPETRMFLAGEAADRPKLVTSSLRMQLYVSKSKHLLSTQPTYCDRVQQLYRSISVSSGSLEIYKSD